MMWWESAARPTSVGGLPTRRLGGRAELGHEALGEHLPHQVGHRDPGQAARAGQVGAARGALAEELLEQQRAVVAAGVLLEQLAPGTERAADRCVRGHIS